MSLPAKRQTDRAAPEAETLEAEIISEQIIVFRKVIVGLLLETAEVANVAADTHVVGELAVETAADIHAKIVRRQIVEQSIAIDVGSNQAEAGRQIRTQAGSRRRAEQQVGHQRGDVAVAEFEVAIAGSVFKEIWRPAEVDFEADHVGVPADRRTEIHAALDFVVRVWEITESRRAAEVGSYKRRNEPALRRRRYR